MQTSKLDISVELLEQAILRFVEGQAYYASLHLAAAAAEVLGRCVAERGGSSAFDEAKTTIFKFVEFFAGPLPSEIHREIVKEMIDPKNSIKHRQGRADHSVEFDAKKEASDWIEMAVLDYFSLAATPSLVRPSQIIEKHDQHMGIRTRADKVRMEVHVQGKRLGSVEFEKSILSELSKHVTIHRHMHNPKETK